ncbi:high mobility group-T protein-like [Takifugu flavidus]|nr:high mobility group-T protein-like [Takifugu flavidus]TWW74607.1 putative high mobility group protein 1-like 1 [Takifugu flavidus]
MKSRPPIRSAAARVPANGACAPPRVIVRSEDTAYRLCALTQPLQTIEIQPESLAFKMGRDSGREAGKPRGKMSSYAFFVQTCREEHKKKHPDASVNFSEFSRKCSERWKTMSVKEKGKFEDLAKQDKVRYDREMMDYVPAKGGKKKKKFKDPNAPKRPPSAFFIFCSEFRPKVKGEHPGLTIGEVAKKLGELWNNTNSEDKQPYEKKASKLKEKYEKDVAAYRQKTKGGSGSAGKAPAKVEKKAEDDDDDEDEDDDDDDDDDDDE